MSYSQRDAELVSIPHLTAFIFFFGHNLILAIEATSSGPVSCMRAREHHGIGSTPCRNAQTRLQPAERDDKLRQ